MRFSAAFECSVLSALTSELESCDQRSRPARKPVRCVRLHIGVDHSEAIGENRAVSSPVSHRILRGDTDAGCDGVAEVGPVEDVDELRADIEVVLAFLTNSEMPPD